MKRLKTTGRETSEAIRDREPFNTSGALKARRPVGLTMLDAGRLEGDDLDQFRLDRDHIDYVVFSYATPIAWHVTDASGGRWHKVEQKFSVSTSRHQGNLYLIRDDA